MRKYSDQWSDPVRLPPRQLAYLILVTAIAGYGVLAIVGVVFDTKSAGQGLLSALFVLALLGIQLGYLSRPDRRPRPPWSYVALVAQAALVFLPITLFGPLWHGFPGLLAGSALLVLPTSVGVPVFVLVIAALGVVSEVGSPLTELLSSVVSLTYTVMAAVVSGVTVFGLSRLVRLVVEAQDAREELNRVVAARERVRLAGDVHDLLGQSLSSIALRGELVARLMGSRDAKVRIELARMLLLARHALAEVRTVTGVRRDPEEPAAAPAAPPPVVRLAPRLASAMIGIVVGALSVVSVVGVTQDRGLLSGVVVGATRVAVIVVILGVTGRPVQLTGRAKYTVPAVLAVLIYVPMIFFGPGTHGAETFLAGVILLLFRPALAVLLAVVLGVGSVFIEYADPAPTPSVAYSLTYAAVGYVLITVVVYGLGAAARLVGEINANRAELSRVAVAEARMRFARDVHDLLGLGLSAITLKCDLTIKLLDHAPARAREELESLLATAHQSLAEVRSVIGGDRELSLDEEWKAVEATLAAAGVDVRLTRQGRPPEGTSGTVLATVLREAATNVLRHSQAGWCEISLRSHAGTVVLEIVNDGVGASAVSSGHDRGNGNGLQNMTDRVEALGGSLGAAAEGELYRLRARVPVAARGASSGRRHFYARI